jgi:hypothetical protein
MARSGTSMSPSAGSEGSAHGDGDRAEQAWAWLALVLVTLCVSAISFLVTGALCGSGVSAGRSAYCRVVGAPALASSPLGISLELLLFGLPPIVAMASALQWVTRRRRPSLTTVTVYCSISLVLSLILLVLAHAQYVSAD